MRDLYLKLGILPLALILALWFLTACTLPGPPSLWPTALGLAAAENGPKFTITDGSYAWTFVQCKFIKRRVKLVSNGGITLWFHFRHS